MNKELASDGAKRGGIDVEGDIDGFPRGKEGSNGGLAEKVKGEFSLREEFVP